MNLALIGYRSSGKTTVSKILQNLLKRKRIEIDREIENAYLLNIEQIIDKYGWQAFRRSEKNLIERFSRKNDHILDLGGGAVLHHQSMLHLKHNALVIFLNCPSKILINRLKNSFKRPALTDLSLKEEVEKILEERMPYYYSYADVVIHSEYNSPLQCARIICSELNRREELLSFIETLPQGSLAKSYAYAGGV